MKSVKSTLHRGEEGQNARRAKFSNNYGQGCTLDTHISEEEKSELRFVQNTIFWKHLIFAFENL